MDLGEGSWVLLRWRAAKGGHHFHEARNGSNRRSFGSQSSQAQNYREHLVRIAQARAFG